MKAEVTIVGAGPAGCSAAIGLIEQGIEPVVLLDRARFPRVKTCAGGISERSAKMLRRLGLFDRVYADAHRITGATIVSATGRRMKISGGQGALVLERSRFDEILKDRAVSKGCSFFDGVCVNSIKPENSRFLVTCSDGMSISSRFVVVATGATARFAGTKLPDSTLLTMTGWYEGVEFDPGKIEMFFDPELEPHYGWLFPESDRRVNIGLCIDRRKLGHTDIKDLFSSFLHRHFSHRFGKARPVRRARGFPITACSRIPVPKVPEGVLVTGEAARLANYFTGEGIYQALKSGLLAADTMAGVIKRGKSRHSMADAYRRRLLLEIGPGLYIYERVARAAHPAIEALAKLNESFPAAKPAIRSVLARL